MTIYEVLERSDSLLQTILAIWEASVRATHHFLSDAEIIRIRDYVPQAVRAVEHLVLAEDASGTPVAFLGAEGHRLEMLFLAPSERGKALAGSCCNTESGITESEKSPSMNKIRRP